MVRTVYNTLLTVSNSVRLRINISNNGAKSQSGVLNNKKNTNPYSTPPVPLATFEATSSSSGGGGGGGVPLSKFCEIKKIKCLKLPYNLFERRKKYFSQNKKYEEKKFRKP
jgi:hypothetical protein